MFPQSTIKPVDLEKLNADILHTYHCFYRRICSLWLAKLQLQCTFYKLLTFYWNFILKSVYFYSYHCNIILLSLVCIINNIFFSLFDIITYYTFMLRLKLVKCVRRMITVLMTSPLKLKILNRRKRLLYNFDGRNV